MRTALTIVAGALAGCLCSWIFLEVQAKAHVAEVPAKAAESSSVAASAPILRVVNLGADAEAAVSGEKKPPDSSQRSSAQDPGSPAESSAVMHREQEQRIAAHDQEPRNATWATNKEKAISEGMQELSKAHGITAQVDKIDCRYESCLTNLSWQEREVAKDDIHKLVVVSAPFTTGCSQSISLDRNAGNTATWLVNCGDDPAAIALQQQFTEKAQ